MLVLTNQKGAGEIQEVAERKADHQPDIFRSVLTIFCNILVKFRIFFVSFCQYLPIFGSNSGHIHLTCGRCWCRIFWRQPRWTRSWRRDQWRQRQRGALPNIQYIRRKTEWSTPWLGNKLSNLHVHFCILSCHEFQKHISLSTGPKSILYKLKTGISRYYNKNRVLHNKWLNLAFLNFLETRKMKLPAKEILMFRARRPSPKQSERLPATSEKVCFTIFRKKMANKSEKTPHKVKEFNHVVKGLGICRPF